MKLSFFKNKTFLYLFSIFLISFLTRVLFFYIFISKNNNFIVPCDSEFYNQMAINFAQTFTYSIKGSPIFAKVPGYSFIVGFFYWLFGCKPKLFLLFQILISSFLPIQIFYLVKKLKPNRETKFAYLSAIFSMFYIGFILYSGLLMTETFFLFFFLIFLLFFFNNNFFLSGIFLGILSLIRPVGQFILPVILVYFLIKLFFYNFKIKSPALSFLKIIIGWLIIIGPWLLRNFIFTGHIFFHTLPGDHFLNLSAAKIYSEVNKSTYFESQKELQNQINLYTQKNNISNEVEICNLKQSLAKKYFISYPFIAVKVWLQDILRTLISLHSSYLVFIEKIKNLNVFTNKESFISRVKFYLMPSNFVLTNLVVWIEIFQYFLLLILFAVFLIKNCIKILLFKIDIKIYFILGLIAMFILISIAGGYARIRVPIEPLIIALSII